MYLILHKYLNPVTHAMCDTPAYKLISAWDAKDALVEFYYQHLDPRIDRTMFTTIINKIDLECAVALHNALKPDFTIVAMYQVYDNAVYIEDVVKENGEVHDACELS